MANKKISDLTLRTDFDTTCLIPVDDATQTWRVTGTQLRTLVQNISNLTEDTAPDAAADYLLSYDTSGTAAKKILLSRTKDVKIQSKSSAYTALVTDDLILGDTGTGWTLTMPAVSASSKPLRVTKTTSDFNALTIARAGSDTFVPGAGTSFILYTQGESVLLIPSGTTWVIAEHTIPSAWTSFTPTFSSGFGTVASISFWWKRQGDTCLIRGAYTLGTVAAAVGTITLPSGLVIDTTKIVTTTGRWSFGRGWRQPSANTDLTTGAASIDVAYIYDGSNTDRVKYARAITSGVFLSENMSACTSSSEAQVVELLQVPISGWTA